MPDSATETDSETTTGADTDEFDGPDLESIWAALESSLASDEHASAVLSCWRAIHDRGTVHVRDLKSHFGEHPLGHDTEEEWWAEDIKPVLESLPGIDTPKGTGSLYRFKY